MACIFGGEKNELCKEYEIGSAINNFCIKNGDIIGIYKITSPTGKVNIGQSINIIDRWRKYKRYNCKSQSKLFRSFKKYGVENHKFEIINICKEIDLNYLEIFYIKKFNTFNTIDGLNIREGGGSHGKMSDSTKIKMSESKKGGLNHTYGKRRSKETCEKISKSLKGNIVSKETGDKISQALKGKYVGKNGAMFGRKATEETKKKQSISKSGNKNSNFGLKMSEERKLHQSKMMSGENHPSWGTKRSLSTRIKQSDSHKGKRHFYQDKAVLQYDKSGKFIREHMSMTKAFEDTGIGADSISSCVRLRTKTSGGFLWKYKNNAIQK